MILVVKCLIIRFFMSTTESISKTKNQLDKLRELFVKPSGSRKGLNRARLLVISLLLIIGAGLVYFYFYSEAEGKKFDTKRFRVLSTLEENIRKKETGYAEIFDYWKEKAAGEEVDYEALKADFGDESNVKLVKDPRPGAYYPGYYHFGNLVLAIKEKSEQDTSVTHTDSVARPVLEEVGVYIEIGKYLAGLIPQEIFDHLIIFTVENGQIPVVKFQNLPNKAVFFENELPDLLKQAPSGFYTGTVLDSVHYLGNDYRLYAHVSDQYRPSASFTENKGQYEIICGMVRESTYVSESRQVNLWWIIILSITVVTTIVSLPMLKVVFMNDLERLKSFDVVLTGMSVIIGAPFILLIILSIQGYSSYYTREQQQDLKHFGQQVDAAFIHELDVLLSDLKRLDGSKRIDAYKTNRDTDKKSIVIPQAIVDSLISYPFVNEIFGLDGAGKQTFSWTTYDTPKRFLDLKERQYYQNFSNGNIWHRKIKDDPDDTIAFTVQSVTSWTTGEHELVAAIRSTPVSSSDDTQYLAVSSLQTSVIHPILRNGYGFAIIDESGTTLFNSNPSRNNSENFIEEINFNRDVQAAIQGKQEIFTQINYWGKRMRCRIQPSAVYPLYVVTFYDLQLSRIFISEVASMCFIFLLTSFLLVGILIYVSSTFFHINRPLLKFKEFVFDWLRPDHQHDSYLLSTIHMFIMMILYLGYGVGVYLIRVPLEELAPHIVSVSLLMPSLLYTSNYWFHRCITLHLKRETDKDAPDRLKKRRIIFLHAWVILIYLIFLFYAIGDHVAFTIIVGSFVGIWFATTYALLRWYWTRNEKRKVAAQEFESVKQHLENRMAEIWYSLRSLVQRLKKEPQQKPVKKVPVSLYEEGTLKSYHWYLRIWLLSSAIAPLWIIFILADNMEEINYSRHETLQLARSMDEKAVWLNDNYRTTTSNLKERWLKNKLYGFQMQDTTVVTETYLKYYSPPKLDQHGSLYLDGTTLVRSDSLYVLEPNPEDEELPGWREWLFYIRPKYGKDMSMSHGLIPNRSTNPKWTFDKPDASEETRLHYNLDTQVGGLASITLTNEMRGNDDVGFSGNKPLYFYFFKGLVVILFIWVTFKVIGKLCRFIFSLDYQKVKASDLSTGFKDEIFLICASQTSKDQTLKSIREHHLSYLDIDHVVRLLLELNTTSDRIAMLRNCFKLEPQYLIASNYPSVLASTLKDDNDQDLPERDMLLEFISKYQQEVALESEYMPIDSAEELIESDPEHELERDKRNWMDQKSHYHYYKGLWEKSSTRERYIMYDLAQDGFANTKNSTSVLYLINKGLLKWDGRLTLFSSGFRTFILTVIKPKEGKQLEKEIASRGSWQTIQYLLYGVIAAVLVFISFGEPDFFSDFNAVLTLIASVVTLFPVVGSLFSVKE